MATKKLNNSKISNIFKSMDYQSAPFDTSAAEKWLIDSFTIMEVDKNYEEYKLTGKIQSLFYPLSVDLSDTKKQFQEAESDTKWQETKPSDKTSVMYKFGEEIKKNSNILCQLELLIRNVVPKDTKNEISLIQDYFEFYANLCSESEAIAESKSKVITVFVNRLYSLGEIGFILASALSRGYNIIFHTIESMCFIVDFIIEIGIKSGIPQETITITVSEFEKLHRMLSQTQVHKYQRLGMSEFPENSKLVILPHGKTTMIVFDDSDLDSACETASENIFNLSGLSAMSIKTILIQEDVFEEFVNKLKTKIKSLRFSNETTTDCDDIAFNKHLNFKVSLEKVIRNAKAKGIEVYQPKTDKNGISPVLFIGGKPTNNDVLEPTGGSEVEPPYGVLSAFRTPSEAAVLANNSKDGLGVSIWTRKASLINEIARKLDFGTVWVNSHGIRKASVGYTTKKYEGIGYLGGIEGFYELPEQSISQMITTNEKLLINVLKPQESWNRLSFQTRAKKLSKALGNDSKLSTSFYKSFRKLSGKINSTQTIDNFNITTFRDPIGLVIINRGDETIAEIVFGALLLGNAVRVVGEGFKRVDVMVKALPEGLIGNITDLSSMDIYGNLRNKVVVIGNDKTVMRSITVQKHYDFDPDGSDIMEFVLRRCTIGKNVWVDVGDSF